MAVCRRRRLLYMTSVRRLCAGVRWSVHGELMRGRGMFGRRRRSAPRRLISWRSLIG